MKRTYEIETDDKNKLTADIVETSMNYANRYLRFKVKEIEPVEQGTIQEIPSKRLEWHPKSKEMTWNEAQEYVKKLGKGWRLPTLIELLQAYYDKIEGFEKDFYWSSTESTATDAYLVYFSSGTVASYHKAVPYYLRAVRAG